MAITINHVTKVISIPQADLAFVSGSLYELDVDAFRLTLKGLEDDADGMALPDTHRHNTTVTVGGATLARVVEIINGYTITFQDLQYAVRLVGANSNIPDVTNVNQVSVRSQNSAELITVVSGSAVTEQDKADIAALAWTQTLESTYTAKDLLRLMAAALAGKVSGAGGTTITIRDAADQKDRIIATVDSDGNRSAITMDVTD